MPVFIPLLYAGGTQLLRHAAMTVGKRAVVKFGKDVVAKNIHKYTGPAAKRKMFDTFMDVSEKVAKSKPVQTAAKNLEKHVNPTIRKFAPDDKAVPPMTPVEMGGVKVLAKLLRGRALKVSSEKIQAIKTGMEQGTITDNEANKFIEKINKQSELWEKSKSNPFM